MFLIIIRAHPKKREGKLKKIGGAYVSCWIDFKDPWGAEELAKLAIKSAGWSPRKIIEIQTITLKNTDKKNKVYFKEAQKFGMSLVFHSWPLNAPDHTKYFDNL